MTARRLLIESKRTKFTTEEFVWRAAAGRSSFATSLDPDLRSIGEVSLPHRDLVAVAAAVFLADRTIARPRGWQRQIELDVPVYDVSKWASVGDDLAQTLEILSADRWTLNFSERRKRKISIAGKRPEVDRALLFSGGADSLCGAIRALASGERLLLVSHWDWAGHSAVQQRLEQALAKKFPKQVQATRTRLGRSRKQLGGVPFGDEPTRRTRSFLFLALGLAHSSIAPHIPLWMAENGYAALNPPLSGERRGALSTRTTHPLVLHGLQAVIQRVGGSAVFENPFASMTKGEMYKEAAELLGEKDASALLSMSHSCSHVRYAAGTGYPPETQCGVCFGCLVRRAAFLASGLHDSSIYLHKAIDAASQPAHLRATAASEIRTIRYAGRRGLTAADLLAMGLPEDLSVEDALEIARKGLSEFARVVDVEPDLVAIE
jgi:7-cyano-7-deazaguanine synthase in queuosine biosynthesis